MAKFLFVSLCFIFAWTGYTSTQDSSKSWNCECGAFSSDKPDENSMPILSHRPINVTCDDNGSENCYVMCTSLAKLAKERGAATLLCAHLPHADKLQVSIFSRICDQQKWNYTGLTSKEPVCCHDFKVVDCNIGKPVELRKLYYI